MAKERTYKKINKKRFTIVLTNYNAEQYLEDALESIYNQTYNNIELIIADDGSNKFSKIKVDKIINKYSAKKNIEVKFVINKENIGTVKTLNKTLEKVTGDYILFFASDDKLANSNVLEKYSDTFDNNKNINVITSNWVLCNEQLEVVDYYKKTSFLNKLNHKSVRNTYSALCCTNIFGAGSTCYRKCIFDDYKFDEHYRYLEDWPLWLKLTNNNERILYINIDGLLHRSGGISYNKSISDTKKVFYKEIMYLYRNYIIKNIKDLSIVQKVNIINSYIYNIEFYSKYIDVTDDKNALINCINNDKKLKFGIFIEKIKPNFIKKLNIMLELNKSVPISFCISFILFFILINTFGGFLESKYLLPILIILYTTIYYMTCTMINIYLSKKGSKK